MADISRSEVASLIAEEYANTLLSSAAAASTALSAFPTVSMGTKTTHMPVLATLPEADWVSETEAKPTSQATWENKTLVAEEIAVILPVHENVLDDASVSILDELAALGGSAIGKKLDQAVLFGTDKPASWTSDALVPAATAGGNLVANVDGPASADDLYGAIVQAAGMVAGDGFIPSTLLTSLALRYKMANIRNADGNLAFQGESFAGFNTVFNQNGSWDPTAAEAIVVDSSKVRIGVRQDITVKFLDQATVGGINLAERDMVALRIKARYAYVLGHGATALSTAGTPVGVVTPDVTP